MHIAQYSIFTLYYAGGPWVGWMMGSDLSSRQYCVLREGAQLDPIKRFTLGYFARAGRVTIFLCRDNGFRLLGQINIGKLIAPSK